MSTAGAPDIAALEKSIGHSFRDKVFLVEALTHRSYYHENPGKVKVHNERLEFLGDSVLGLVVVEYLYNAAGRLPESLMSKIKSYIVRSTIISEVAKEVSLGDFIMLGKGEEDTGGRHKRSILSDTMEAVIGAVCVDAGFDRARDLVIELFRTRMDDAVRSGEFHDYKTELQEESQLAFGLLPQYRLVKEEGAEHKKVFTVEVSIAGKPYGRGAGRSKKEAQTEAAEEALKKIRGSVTP